MYTIPDDNEERVAKCSSCGKTRDYLMSRCPNCGEVKSLVISHLNNAILDYSLKHFRKIGVMRPKAWDIEQGTI